MGNGTLKVAIGNPEWAASTPKQEAPDQIRGFFRSPDERTDIRDGAPAYRCSHAGYGQNRRMSWAAQDQPTVTAGFDFRR